MSPGSERGRPGGATSDISTAIKNDSSVRQAAEHVAHFRVRVLVEGLLDGWSLHNERQARRWLDSRPRPGDFIGTNATVEDHRERWRRMTAIAAAYRNRATLAPLEELSAGLVSVLRESEGEAIAC